MLLLSYDYLDVYMFGIHVLLNYKLSLCDIIKHLEIRILSPVRF